MYESFDPSDRIFVNRDEYLKWMDQALERCKEKSVVLHLRGIGGIGKSSLLNYWTNTIDSTVRLDCQQYTEFYSRLDILARGSVRVGITLRRFDVLWHIRKRFVEGVEPAQEKGREWAKEVVMAIPFIGSLASIGSAIKAVGDSVAPKLRKRYGEVGTWLQNRLGTEYVEKLLEILWKEPHHAEFLFLDALVEDLNNRKNPDTPILFLFDHSENVDAEERRWRYAGKKITETELWYVFLSSLKNCVGVVASRNQAPEGAEKEYSVERAELTELDKASSIELLERRNVTTESLQEQIVSVSGGNPFILDAICDMLETRKISLDDIESLRADTLEDVRLKTWRKLFSQAKDLLYLVDRAGLVPYFAKKTMDIIAPDMKTDQWERFIRLSFVKHREDGTKVLHDLARELVRAELGKKLIPLVEEVSGLLEKSSIEEDDLTLLGQAYSVLFLTSEEIAIQKAMKKVVNLLENYYISEAFSILENLTFASVKGHAELQGLKGMALYYVNRRSESEILLKEAIRINEELSNENPDMHLDSVAKYSHMLGFVLTQEFKVSEAEPFFKKSIETQRKLVEKNPNRYLEDLVDFLMTYAYHFYIAQQPDKGLPLAEEAIELSKDIDNPILKAETLHTYGIVLHNSRKQPEAERAFRESLKIYRELFEKNPENPMFKAKLAAVLSNMIEYMQDESEIDEHFAESIHLRRELAELGTEAFQSGLAIVLWLHAIFLVDRFNHIDAVPLLKESLGIYSKLVNDNPGVWDLRILMIDIAYLRMYIESGKVSEAQTLIDQLTLKFKDERLSIIHPAVLNSLAVMHMNALNEHEAEIALKEAIKKFEAMGGASIELTFVFIMCLVNYCTHLMKSNRISEAREFSDKALSFLREFEGLSRYNGFKAIFHNTLAMQQDQLEKARELFEEAVRLLDDFVTKFPSVGLPGISTTLNNYSLILKKKGELDEAERTLKRALDIKIQLAESKPSIFEDTLAITLNNWGVFLYERGKKEEAEDIFRQALQIRRKLVEERPSWHRLELASILHNLGVFLRKEERGSEAEDAFRESIAIREELAKTAPNIIQRIQDLIGNPEDEKWFEEEEFLYHIW